MRKNVQDAGSGLLVGGVVAVVSIFAGLTPMHIALWSIITGIICMVISHYFYDKIIMLFKQIVKWFKLVLKVLFNMREAAKILILKDDQQKNPEKWLFPVIQYIDLNRLGGAHDDNDVYVQFQIDSGLLYPLSEYYLCIQLCLKIQYTAKQVESGWYKIAPQNLLLTPIHALERNGINNKYDRYNKSYENLDWGKYVDNSYIIHLGLTEKAKGENKTLLKWIEQFRKEREGKECFTIDPEEQLQGIGGKIEKDDITIIPSTKGDKLLVMLKIGIAFKKEDEDKPPPIILDGSRWITPANNYRS